MSSIVIALVFVSVFNVQSLQVIPQKINIIYVNEKYIKWVNVSIKRYGRKSGYYVNIQAEKYHTWDNNITHHLITYEYLHNEYRRSFVESHLRLCDMITSDPYGGGMLKSKGVTCPVVTNELRLMNLTLPTNNFAYVFPFEKGRLDNILTITKTGEAVMETQVLTIFKDVDNKQRNKKRN